MQNSLRDPVGVQGVGLADATVNTRVHAGGLCDLVAGLRDVGVCEPGTVGRYALDHPQHGHVASGPAGDPRHGPLQPGWSGGELLIPQPLAGSSGDDGVSVIAGVGVHPDDERMGMGDDSHSGSGSFQTTTGGPSGPLHNEFTLSVRVQCDAPARAVAFLDVGGIRWHARDWARRAEHVAALTVSFFPDDWENTDRVQSSAADGGIRVQVDSAALKVDPVATTRLDVRPGTYGFTGVPMSILSVPGVALGVLLIRSTDTKADRTRWRVRDEHVGALAEFSFLATSDRAGQTALTP